MSGLIAMAASFGGNELCLRYGRRRVITFVVAGSALTAGAAAAARPGTEGATLAVYAFIGIGPLILGVVLDATGGGATSLSWGLAFVSMAVIVLLEPLALRLCR